MKIEDALNAYSDAQEKERERIRQRTGEDMAKNEQSIALARKIVASLLTEELWAELGGPNAFGKAIYPNVIVFYPLRVPGFQVSYFAGSGLVRLRAVSADRDFDLPPGHHIPASDPADPALIGKAIAIARVSREEDRARSRRQLFQTLAEISNSTDAEDTTTGEYLVEEHLKVFWETSEVEIAQLREAAVIADAHHKTVVAQQKAADAEKLAKAQALKASAWTHPLMLYKVTYALYPGKSDGCSCCGCGEKHKPEMQSFYATSYAPDAGDWWHTLEHGVEGRLRTPGATTIEAISISDPNVFEDRHDVLFYVYDNTLRETIWFHPSTYGTLYGEIAKKS